MRALQEQLEELGMDNDNYKLECEQLKEKLAETENLLEEAQVAAEEKAYNSEKDKEDMMEELTKNKVDLEFKV